MTAWQWAWIAFALVGLVLYVGGNWKPRP